MEFLWSESTRGVNFKVSFFAPAYNEEKNIAKVIDQAEAVLRNFAEDYEIIIVEDGSPDRTREVIDKISRRNPKIIAIHHPHNLGYGAALRTGFAACRYDIIAYTDGDHQFDLEELPRLIDNLKQYDIVIGRRVKRADNPFRIVESKIYNTIVNIIFRLGVRDVDCAFKVFRKAALRTIAVKSNSPFLNVEIISIAKRLGFRICEVDVSHYPRRYGRASGARPGLILRTVGDMIYHLISNKITKLADGKPLVG